MILKKRGQLFSEDLRSVGEGASSDNEGKESRLLVLWRAVERSIRYSHIRQMWINLRLAVKNLWRSPWHSLFTFLSVFLSMAICAGFLLVYQNLSGYVGGVQTPREMKIYLEDSISNSRKRLIVNEVESLPQVESVFVMSKDDAFAEFRESLGSQSLLLEGLEDVNPLPASIRVILKKDGLTEDSVYEIVSRFSEEDGIEYIHHSQKLIAQAGRLLGGIKLIGLIIGAMVFTIAAFIVMCTVRFSLYSRREELEIMRLVGATPGQVKIPALLEGAVIGICGAAIAVIAINVIFAGFLGSVVTTGLGKAFAAYLSLPGVGSMAAILGLGFIVGTLGSYFAVREVA